MFTSYYEVIHLFICFSVSQGSDVVKESQKSDGAQLATLERNSYNFLE